MGAFSVDIAAVGCSLPGKNINTFASFQRAANNYITIDIKADRFD